MKILYSFVDDSSVSIETEHTGVIDVVNDYNRLKANRRRREKKHGKCLIESFTFHSTKLGNTYDFLEMIDKQNRARLVKAAIPHMPSDQQRMLVWLIAGVSISDMAPRYGVRYTDMLKMLKQAVADLEKLIKTIE